MIYVDTSVLVSALTREAATPAAQAWLWSHPPFGLAISDWTRTEFSAAVSMKARMGRITPEEMAATLAEFRRVTPVYFLCWRIDGAMFEQAARLCERVISGLRASDALHLAVAQAYGAALATLDLRLAEAAQAAGVEAIRPG